MQIFLICPKFEGKVASQSWKHCIYIQVKKKAFKINAKIEDVGLNED